MSDNTYREKLIGRSKEFSIAVMRLVDEFPKKRSARVISDQLLRSATSVGANIAEAQMASSKRDFVNFLNHALKSSYETNYWLVNWVILTSLVK